MEHEPDEMSNSEAFEEAIARKDERCYYLRLYIAGTTLQSIYALENIKRVCEEYLPGRYTLEVIDIYQQPELARPENIIAVPTLIKTLPPPLQRIIGDLSKTERILVGLDIEAQEDQS